MKANPKQYIINYFKIIDKYLQIVNLICSKQVNFSDLDLDPLNIYQDLKNVIAKLSANPQTCWQYQFDFCANYLTMIENFASPQCIL